MTFPKSLRAPFWGIITLLISTRLCQAQEINIKNDPVAKQVVLGNSTLTLTLDYNKKARIVRMEIKGQPVITHTEGVYSQIKTQTALYSSLELLKDPQVRISRDRLVLSGISYGDKHLQVNENWIFTCSKGQIKLDLERTLSKAVRVDQAALPVFNFDSINTWEGSYQDYGGLAWFYLFNQKLETYGVHSSSARFWNSKTGNGLSVSVAAPGRQVALDYSRNSQDQLSFSIRVSSKEMAYRLDTGTYRRRFVRDRQDVWAPFEMTAGKSSQTLTLSYFDFNAEYGRGQFAGINGGQVSGVLNTIARIGVIDKQHFGGNSWHTPYGPICLHEQYIAQMGLAINDPAYLKGYQQCLDFYRDNALKPDGRVWPRWAYNNEDMMPGEVTPKGFYEAQWGYLLDANPDLVTNVAELYDQTGNKAWVKSQQRSCEKALDWILKRDENKNGLVEMMTDSHTQKRGSDWIDIIWAAYENAFVNAKLYHALLLWAAIEKQLGNTQRGKYYSKAALKLKTSFNKPVSEGGFWDPEKQCYIHWRDKDGSVHGNNLVTPVNFMAIAYGICEDRDRAKTILDTIEAQMQKEKLFFWPICMYTYGPGEGNDWQFPFPNYENGDLFLSWGAVGVRAYADYRPDLAVKYVKQVLEQYSRDGLAFQRYGRAAQDGRGDDILSGNSLSVVGLYQAIYGINPLYNRFYLQPHLTPELSGTRLNYRYRGQKLAISLDTGKYSVSGEEFTISAAHDFGYYVSGNELSYFAGKSEAASLKVKTDKKAELKLEIKDWTARQRVWIQASANKVGSNLNYQLTGLDKQAAYRISINGKEYQKLNSSATGTLNFRCHSTGDPVEIQVNKY